MHLKSPRWRYSIGAAAAGLLLCVASLCPDLILKAPGLDIAGSAGHSPSGAAKAADPGGAENIFVAYPPDNGKVPASASYIVGPNQT